ncbi:MAG: Ig-like domain-containing protein [Spirochaetota bacterium]|nr:Ig-like domain-containing protein [Spirochaetota bacterium]
MKKEKYAPLSIFLLIIFYLFASGCGGGSGKGGDALNVGGDSTISSISDQIEGEGYNEVTLEGDYYGSSYTYSNIYFNIRKGELVPESSSNSKEWGIMIKGSYIYTNSGSSASVEYGEGSLGNGGWYFTGLTGLDDLSAITVDDVNKDIFREDYRAWINENPFTMGEVNCNGMLLLTTIDGSGTRDDPYMYDTSNIENTSDDEAIIWMRGIPPECYSTERIYIIRCADGVSYGKLMFGMLEQDDYFTDCKYNVTLYYKNLTPGDDIDTTPPTIVSTLPEDGAGGISVSDSIFALFSEEIDTGTINTNTYKVSNGASELSGTVEYNNSKRSACFIPLRVLDYETTYTVTISTGVSDIAGNNMKDVKEWSFTTERKPIDVPPTITDIFPEDNAVNVPICTTISAIFDKDMDADTINADTFKMNNNDGEFVAGEVEYSKRKVTFKPLNDLDHETVYTVTITTGVADTAGNNMESKKEWVFTTAETGGYGSGYETITVEGTYYALSYSYSKIYFNLRTGEEVPESESATMEWDIMIKGSYFYTNGGSTASEDNGEGSFGEGGWYFTGLEGLDSLSEITSNNVDQDLFEEDYRTWINENPFTQGEVNCNRMLLLTTTNGSGAEDDPYEYTTSNIEDKDDDEAIIYMKGIPPQSYSTDRIYIIRCTDGTSYGKLMFGSMEQASYFSNCKYRLEFYYNCLTDQTSEDITPPIVVSTAPKNNATDVSVISSIVVRFSEEMNINTVTPDRFCVSDGTGYIDGTVEYSNKEARFAPYNLDYGADYTATISRDVEDLAGNCMEEDYEFKFQTTSTPPQWKVLGYSGISDGEAKETKIHVSMGVPYVAYVDAENGSGATVKMYEGGNWMTVGEASFSDNEVEYISLYVDGDTPYIAYRDKREGLFINTGALTVKKYGDGNWISVGDDRFTPNKVRYTSLYVDDGVPYVAFRSYYTSYLWSYYRAMAMKFDKGDWIWLGGNHGFSEGDVKDVSFYIYSGIPYAAYCDKKNDNEAKVMRYDNEKDTWDIMGDGNLSGGGAEYTSLFVCDDITYIAYRDESINNRATLMMYTDNEWYAVGDPGFSGGDVQYISLFVYNNIPYVAYRDGNLYNKATLMGYINDEWIAIGGDGFSDGEVKDVSLYIYNGIPYVAFNDASCNGRATVMKFE